MSAAGWQVGHLCAHRLFERSADISTSGSTGGKDDIGHRDWIWIWEEMSLFVISKVYLCGAVGFYKSAPTTLNILNFEDASNIPFLCSPGKPIYYKGYICRLEEHGEHGDLGHRAWLCYTFVVEPDMCLYCCKRIFELNVADMTTQWPANLSSWAWITAKGCSQLHNCTNSPNFSMS